MSLSDAATRHQIFIQRYGTTVWNDVRPVLRRLARDVAGRLAQASTDFQRGRLTAIYGDVRAILDESAGALTKQLELELTRFGEYEAGFQARMLESAVTVSVSTPPLEAIAAAVTSSKASLLQGGRIVEVSIPQMIRQFAGNREREVRGIIARGFIEGQTSDELTRSVRRVVTGRMPRQAEALVRTSVNHMASVAREETLKANADIIQGERYMATLDSATTLTCAGHDQEVHPVGVGPIPPLHFNCRSVRVPEVRDDLRVPGLVRERASADGPVDARTTYNSWLRRQPHEVQDEVLGTEKAKLFRSGLHVDKFTDDAGRPLTLEALKGMESLTL